MELTKESYEKLKEYKFGFELEYFKRWAKEIEARIDDLTPKTKEEYREARRNEREKEELAEMIASNLANEIEQAFEKAPKNSGFLKTLSYEIYKRRLPIGVIHQKYMGLWR